MTGAVISRAAGWQNKPAELQNKWSGITLGFALSVSFPALVPTAWATDDTGHSASQQVNGGVISSAESQVDAVRLIEAMSVALNTLNYEGVFVHAQGENLTSMHILHSSDDSDELERLRALDGEAREVVRNSTLVTCIWPASQSVIVSKSIPRNVLPQVDASMVKSERYVFEMGASDRVAGRQTHVVNVTPRDGYRYGYRFWIDKTTSMLLRSMLLEGPENPVEQIIFTQIDYPASIDTSRFAVADTDKRVSWLEPKKARAASSLQGFTQKPDDRVQFSGLPEGYREISETYSAMPIEDGPVSHVMLSDGMASVSVYVEYVKSAQQSRSSLGLSRMGAMSAFGISTKHALITAVGEVPAATVKAIAAAVLLRD